MHDAHDFLLAVTIVLGVAAVTTVLFHLLKQPVVLGYILAGVIIGPHTPIPLVADQATVTVLSELGVILLMFYVGLEMRLQTLWKLAPTAGITGIIQCSVMVWLGFVTGRAFGWTVLESLFAGSIIAISSTTIIAKAFDEQQVTGRLRELVIGILIVEDLIAIVLMAMLTAIASGTGLSAHELAATTGRLGAFLIALIVVGLFVVPRLVRVVLRLKRPETTVVTMTGLCFAVALLAQEFGYSVALGAFLAGSLVAESGAAKRIEHRIEAVRDVFAAIFFVSVGMMIDPELIAAHWRPILVLTAVVVVGKIVSVTLGAFLTGAPPRLAIQSGMSLAQIGEFSFIIAGLGLTLGATREFLYPVAVSVSAITTLTTPFLIRASGGVAERLDLALPKSMQTFVSLYGSWLQQMRQSTLAEDGAAKSRRIARLLAVDAALLAAVVIGASLSRPRIVEELGERFGFDERISLMLLVAGAVAVAIPFAIGIVRLSRGLGAHLAESAMPKKIDTTDLADAPRRVFVVTLQLAAVLVSGMAVVAVTQPFLPGVPGAALLAFSLVVLAFSFWRRAENLEGHVRAGAQVIAEALAKQTRGSKIDVEQSLVPVQQLLPGLGAPEPWRVDEGAACVGKTLADIGLRAHTGATVLAISRDGLGILVPSPREVIRAGDVLALAGTEDAVTAAKKLLVEGPETREA